MLCMPRLWIRQKHYVRRVLQIEAAGDTSWRWRQKALRTRQRRMHQVCKMCSNLMCPYTRTSAKDEDVVLHPRKVRIPSDHRTTSTRCGTTLDKESWLEMCPESMLGLSSLFFIGTPRKTSGRNLSVRLDHRLMKAVADTGSDLNLMSLACAEREGFRIDRSFDA